MENSHLFHHDHGHTDDEIDSHDLGDEDIEHIHDHHHY